MSTDVSDGQKRCELVERMGDLWVNTCVDDFL